jgi:hypothetical protein
MTASLVLAGFAFAQDSHAHRDVRVGICIPSYKGGPCARGKAAPSYLYGQKVVVKGKVNPRHAGTVKVERRKRKRAWRVVARERLEAGRRYRYVWQTRRRHADQGDPYEFRAILPGHDVSRVQKVYVLYSE